VTIRDAVLHRDGERVDAVRLRYRSTPVPAVVPTAGTGRHAELEVELGEAFDAASPGQAAVLLCGEAIVGHGTIAAGADAGPMLK
jgi:tRNA U34 2-thiouridine synthase MnmA/TrmU